jgi:hypothetical protein
MHTYVVLITCGLHIAISYCCLFKLLQHQAAKASASTFAKNPSVELQTHAGKRTFVYLQRTVLQHIVCATICT